MKMPNVYVGQFHDIRHGAVYTNILEAVKEVTRAQQAGMVIQFCYLPDAEKYWIAGTIGKGWDPRYNFIFTSSSEAEQHIDKVLAKGWPKAQVLCKELKIVEKGPDTIDIKTEEHLVIEREAKELRDCIERGFPIANDDKTFYPKLVWEDSKYHFSWDMSETVIINLDAGVWSKVEDPVNLFECVKRSVKLLKEMAEVDQDEQPNKWRRLQGEAIKLYDGLFPADGTPETPVDPTSDV